LCLVIVRFGGNRWTKCYYLLLDGDRRSTNPIEAISAEAPEIPE
jgi:hypothetical protein